jgi:hypothetical protein
MRFLSYIRFRVDYSKLFSYYNHFYDVARKIVFQSDESLHDVVLEEASSKSDWISAEAFVIFVRIVRLNSPDYTSIRLRKFGGMQHW